MMFCLSLFSLFFLSALGANATPLVSGNGHGFIVVSEGPARPVLTKFYAHPYRFEKPDPKEEYGEGIETANLIESLQWTKAKSRIETSTEYLDQSQVIAATSEDSRQFFWMPFGLELNAFVTSCESENSAECGLRLKWAHPVRTEERLIFERRRIRFLRFEGVNESLLLYPLGEKSWLFASIENSRDLNSVLQKIQNWRQDLDHPALLSRELAEFEAWRVREPHFQSPPERQVWRQSETVLRMAQIREPNRPGRFNHGLILASLPEGMWFVSWVRDMAYATIALIRMGHQQEARWALEAYFNARPIGRMQNDVRGFPYQISVVRYFGDGSEEPYFTMEGWPNIEFDNWGLALWALSEYVEKFGDWDFLKTPTYRGLLYDSAKDYIVRPLLGNLDPFGDGLIVSADTSIWEEAQSEAKHFAYSTTVAIHGLAGFAKLARAMRDEPTEKLLAEQLPLLRRGFRQAFTDRGWIRGTLEESEKNDIDGAVLESIYLGVEQDPRVIDRTLQELEKLRMPSGGYRRVRGETQYERQEFLFINFSLADIYLHHGEKDNAAELLRPMTEKSALDHGLIPEMYVSEINDQFPGEIGTPTGSIPMVGYGAGIYIRHLLEREGGL